MLIGMSLRKAQFPLPQTAEFASYYGISKATLERGIKELTATGLINMTGLETYETGETRTGYGERILYGFRPPFDLNVRKSRTRDPAPEREATQDTTKVSNGGASTLKPFVLPPHVKTILNNGPKTKPAGTLDFFLSLAPSHHTGRGEVTTHEETQDELAWLDERVHAARRDHRRRRRRHDRHAVR